MDKKSLIRKKYLLKRKKEYFNIDHTFFNPLVRLLNKKKGGRKLVIAIYYPCNYEMNILKIFDSDFFKSDLFLLPIIEKNKSMNFYKWKKNDVLFLNKYGVPEPKKSKKIFPNLVLTPLLAFDRYKNRLGYGKGFYDKYLHKLQQSNKKILTVGIAFSFQKHHKLPVNKNDYRLDYIITEKGII